MQYVKLGRSGLDVSRIAIGAMSYGDPSRGHPVWSLDEEASRPLIRQALEAGINLFDTANMYSQGSSEEILGRALADMAYRDEVVIATKVRHRMFHGPNGTGLSRKAIMEEVEKSLRRLGTDYIDLYQIHRLDTETPWEETLETLDGLVKSGKVRYLGASSMAAWQFSKLLHMQERNGWTRFISMQDHYNLLAREEEREMLPLCQDAGVSTIPWSPLARGLLTRPVGEGTFRTETDHATSDYLYTDPAADAAIIDAVGVVAERHGVSRAQIALAWLRSNAVVAAPLVGASKPSQIADAVASLEVVLLPDDVALLQAPYRPRTDTQGFTDNAIIDAMTLSMGAVAERPRRWEQIAAS